MTLAALLAFAGTTLLLVLTPGLDSMLVIRHSVAGGIRAGLATIAGTLAGTALWAAASVAGLTALLTASPVAYDAVRIGGAGYLIWMGVSALYKSFRAGKSTVDDAADQPLRPLRALRRGIVTNVLNPKVGVFFISLLPQFLPTTGNNTGWAALLVGIHLGLCAAWYPVLAVVGDRARTILRQARFRRILDRVTAGVLVGLGLKLALQSG
ncbi:LysE family translocator [Fodinicola feengrottensis]|uniref:LysE family translocator n=1 Tax=Fodinicola feengrottensis TaxID=435914 RepID=A0ABN2FVM0_9ACTN|nr:LysE family translocator [Fodinicola feengrottensis]